MTLRGLLKRIGVALLTAFTAMLATFVLLRLTPGSAVDGWARNYAIQNSITLDEAYRRVSLMINYNPKEPIYLQLGRYLGGLLHGDLGHSMIYQNQSVTAVIAAALPWTIFVLTFSLLISFLVGINLGSIMAWKRKSILDPILSIYYVVFSAIPNFIVALILLIIFAFSLGWFPISGAYDPDKIPGFNLPFIINIFYHGALPMLTYFLCGVGGWAVSMKGNAVSVLGEDYIQAAWVRGVPDKNIQNNYVKKNAMLPLITGLAMNFAGMLGGSTLIENSFSYPGMGYYLGQSIGQRDYILMQGIFLVISLAVILANLIADLCYAKLDPRIKLEE